MNYYDDLFQMHSGFYWLLNTIEKRNTIVYFERKAMRFSMCGSRRKHKAAGILPGVLFYGPLALSEEELKLAMLRGSMNEIQNKPITEGGTPCLEDADQN